MPASLKLIIYPIQLLYSIWTWTICLTFLIVHFIVANLVVPFVKEREKVHIMLTRPFIKVGFFLCGMWLTTEGIQNFPPNRNFIIISNHQSHLDILVYLLICPYKFSFFAKRELLKVPFLGRNIQDQGHFVIDRENGKQALRQLEAIKAKLIAGKSLLVFPEGTRSETGEIASFKRGGFNLAVNTGLPIVPCFLWGTHRILKKRRLLSAPGKIHLVVGKPIPTNQVVGSKIKKKEAAVKLMAQTREIVLKMHEEFLRRNPNS